MPGIKQHHFVQKAYLDGFLAPDCTQLICYGRRGIHFKKKPDELGMRRKYYSVRNEDGSWDDRQEEMIERLIETPGLAVLQKLKAQKTRLNWKDRQALSMYFAFQEQRTPAAREQARLMSGMMTERILADVKAANPNQKSIGLGGKDGNVNDVTLVDIARSHQDLCDDHAFSIHHAQIGATLELQPYYQQMKWTVFYAMGTARFVTTDTPVIRVHYGKQTGGTGLSRADVEIRFPLSAKALLTVRHDMPRVDALFKANDRQRDKILNTLPEVAIQHAPDKQVMFFNRGQVRHAQVWVYAGEDCPWIPELLEEPCARPRMVDMSTREVMHMRSDINYDPFCDAG